MPKTLLTKYKIADLVKILNIEPEEAKRLKTDPSASLSLHQFAQLSPTLPDSLLERNLTLRRKRAKQHISKYRLPKSIDSLGVEILTPPGRGKSTRAVRLFYKRKKSDYRSLITNILGDDPGMILQDLFENAEYRKNPFSDPRREAQRREAIQYSAAIQAELRKIFGMEYEMFRDLFTKEDYKQFYDVDIPVRKNLMTYYSLISWDEPKYGRDTFAKHPAYSDFARYEIRQTSNPFFIPYVIEQLTHSYHVHHYKNNSVQIWSNGFLQLLAVGKIEDNEIVFCYPVVKGTDDHVFTSLPFINLYTHAMSIKTGIEVRIFLTPGLKIELTPDPKRQNIENAHRVLLNNRRWARAVVSQEELDYMLKNPSTKQYKKIDFTQFPAHKLWIR